MRKFEKVSYDDTGILPTRADLGSAGHDFYTPIDLEIKPREIVKFNTNILEIKPREIVKFNTNIKVIMEPDEVLLLFVRSSIGIKKNLMLCNGTGVIDSTYYNNPDNEGNIIGALFNYGNETQYIKAGERVIQGVFVKYLITDNDKPLSDKRIGGVGSSGK